MFRLDSSGLHGYEWTLLAYVPDDSTVKERMLYASTRDIMKRQLGYTYFANEMYGTDPVTSPSARMWRERKRERERERELKMKKFYTLIWLSMTVHSLILPGLLIRTRYARTHKPYFQLQREW